MSTGSGEIESVLLRFGIAGALDAGEHTKVVACLRRRGEVAPVTLWRTAGDDVLVAGNCRCGGCQEWN